MPPAHDSGVDSGGDSGVERALASNDVYVDILDGDDVLSHEGLKKVEIMLVAGNTCLYIHHMLPNPSPGPGAGPCPDPSHVQV